MFWECHIVTSSIDKLLDQPIDNLKLEDFLNENDLIQECLTQNKRLIDYLIQPQIIDELIEYIIKIPIDNNFRYPCIVSELLSGDFQLIQEKLIETQHLNLLYSFLLNNNQINLNPILSSYFSRIFLTLIIRKSNEIIEFFKSCQTFKQDFLNHLYSTSITDILFRLISESGEQRSKAIKWYEDINLIDDLIDILLKTNSIYIQMNIVNLLSEFLRLAFDQNNDIQENNNNNNSSLTIESNSNDQELLSSNLSPSNNEEKFTPLILAQHILSKSNLERLFDTLSVQPKLVANGCDFLINILDLLGRYIPAPICIPLVSSNSISNIEENEQMQINDEEDTLSIDKSNETKLLLNAKNPLIDIYLIFLEVIPSRLPSLINILLNSSPPLIPPSSPSHDNSQTVKYQFISEPLGIIRLNLIKFFSKLIQLITNDYIGDLIYEILDSNHLLNILIDLFFNHIYNNFLHTQVYQIIHHLFSINSLAIKQSNNIWIRISLSSNLPNYLNRFSYKFFQSLLISSKVNLIERLLDQYEINLSTNKTTLASSSSDDTISSSLLHTRFSSPNSGHIIQILQCLREYSDLFNNYLNFYKNDQEQQADENINVFEIRWQTAIDYLIEDEKKTLAMHHNERNNTNSFQISTTANIMAHINNVIHLNDSTEANKKRHTFHMRSFGSSGAPYIDDDDDIDRFDIDDELMNNEQTTSEQKLAEMKKTSFETQFPPVFDEQTFWNEKDETNNNDTKITSVPSLPDLFENYRMQHDKSASTTESNFEELCSLRANDHGSDRVIFPFQSSSSTNHEEIEEGQDEF